MLDVGDIFSELHVTGSRHILKFHILSKKKIVAQNGHLFKDERTVPPFVTTHTFCASRDIRVSQGICPLIQQYFFAVYDYVEKGDLSKDYQNPKRKLGVTTHFSEIIGLKFGKKLPYIL